MFAPLAVFAILASRLLVSAQTVTDCAPGLDFLCCSNYGSADNSTFVGLLGEAKIPLPISVFGLADVGVFCPPPAFFGSNSPECPEGLTAACCAVPLLDVNQDTTALACSRPSGA